MGDLIERLREKNGKGKHSLGYHPLINPDGPEAADRIENLEAQLAEAVALLQSIAHDSGQCAELHGCQQCAYHENRITAYLERMKNDG